MGSRDELPGVNSRNGGHALSKCVTASPSATSLGRWRHGLWRGKLLRTRMHDKRVCSTQVNLGWKWWYVSEFPEGRKDEKWRNDDEWSLIAQPEGSPGDYTPSGRCFHLLIDFYEIDVSSPQLRSCVVIYECSLKIGLKRCSLFKRSHHITE